MKSIFYYLAILFTTLVLFSCETDPCDPISCQNGGTCINGFCNCPLQWTGNNCETPACDVLVCLHGGQCVDGICNCVLGYEGITCQILTSSKFSGSFLARQSCNTTGDKNYLVSVSPGIAITDLEIDGLLQVGGTLQANLESDSSFSIPLQSYGSGDISGTGLYKNGLIVEYDYDDGTQVHVCSAFFDIF